MTRFTEKEARRLADMAGRSQNVDAEMSQRSTLLDGLRIITPNHGESLFIYAMRTIAPDLLALHPIHDVEVFPEEQDLRRVDFSFLPTPVVIEIHGGIHARVTEKAEKDWLKANALQMAGAIVLQFTPHQLEVNPVAVVETVREALRMQAGKTCTLVHKQKMGDDY